MSVEKQIHRAGPYADFFCEGVKVGNTLTLAGQVGMAADGTIPDSVTAQAEIIYASIKDILAEFGATMDNIIDETMFVTDMADCMANVGPLFTARAQAYGKKPEVSQTMVGISALVDPALKIEVKVIAAL